LPVKGEGQFVEEKTDGVAGFQFVVDRSQFDKMVAWKMRELMSDAPSNGKFKSV